MKSIALSLLIVFTLFSCSKNESSSNENQYEITGKFLAPNNLDPVSGAQVRAYQNGQQQSQTITDAQGNFVIELNAGDYNLVINKGKFKTERTVAVDRSFNLDSLLIDSFPTIAVVTGSFDNIESVLYSIGLFNPVTQQPLFDIVDGSGALDRQAIGNENTGHHHGGLERNSNNPLLQPNVDFSFEDMITDQAVLEDYDIVFLNCGLSESLANQSDVFETYVSNGGILYATDWAASYLDAITNSGSDYLTPYLPAKSGSSTSTVATILNGELSDWLLLNYGISIDDTVLIDDFLPSWQVIDSFDRATTISWLNGPVSYWDADNNEISEDKDLAFTFLHGEGGVFYSSFHTENSEIEDVTSVERVMQFLVFEMSDLQ